MLGALVVIVAHDKAYLVATLPQPALVIVYLVLPSPEQEGEKETASLES